MDQMTAGELQALLADAKINPDFVLTHDGKDFDVTLDINPVAGSVNLTITHSF
jgi:hypothetical protein